MSFVLSKILWPLASPGNLVTLVALVALGVQGWREAREAAPRWSRCVPGAVVALVLVLLSLVPLGPWLVLALEKRVPIPVLPERVDGVVVLGGALDVSASVAWGRPTLNGGADRMTEFAALARRYPEARLVFTGGSGSLSHPELGEAPIAREVLERLGAPVARVTFESQSRNTSENIRFTYDLVRPKPGETWVVINSALQMPRTIGLCRRLGWSVVPDPVAYRSGIDAAEAWGPGLAKNLYWLDDAVHEGVGLVAYYLMGRTSAIFPAP